MTERLADRLEKLEDEAVERQLRNEEMAYEAFGEGGHKLSPKEAHQRYLEVTADENLRREKLAQAQVRFDMQPHQIPKAFFKQLEEMEAWVEGELGE